MKLSANDWKEVLEQHDSFWMPIVQQRANQYIEKRSQDQLLDAVRAEAIQAAGLMLDDPWSSF